MEKWSYTEKSAAGLRSEVHYVRDPKTGQLMDFKFKHHAETYK
jgi:filamentous hemagglutinin